MKKRVSVPGNRTLMPVIVKILQENGGSLNCSQVAYMVLFQYNLPKKVFKKACNEVNFSSTYLKKIGALRKDVPRGTWALSDEFMSMDKGHLKEETYRRYDELLERR